MPGVATADGLELYAEAHGEGPPVLLSCALCTTHENWRPQVEPLVEAGFRAVIGASGFAFNKCPHKPYIF